MKNKLIIMFIWMLTLELSANDGKNIETKIFKNLRCIICQGQSISESNSDFAQTIKSVVRDKINQGKNEQEIYNFLVEKYGEWIIYKPPFNLHNSLLWVLPYLLFVLGGFFIFFIVKKRKILGNN